MPGGVANLTPFNTLTPERRREISVMGGKARAEQRRQQRQEINRIKAEEIALRELDEAENSVFYLAALVREMRQLALVTGAIEKPKRCRDGYRWAATPQHRRRR